MLTTFPSTRISPASGRSIPERMLIRVDLPAPFSPSRQCTSPCRAASETSSFATTPGNRFVMPSSSTAGAPVGVAALRLSDSVRSLCVVHGGRRSGRRALFRAASPTRLLLLDQRLDLSRLGRQRHLDRAVHDARLRSLDLRPHVGGDQAGLEERDPAVRERQVVTVRTVVPRVDVRDRLLEREGEAPTHRREEDVLLVVRAYASYVCDDADLV